MLVPRDTESTSEPAHAFVKRVRRERERAIEALKQAQDRMARNANKHRREHTFQVDDKVWLAASHVRLPHALTAKRKLQPRYYGPFRVTKVVSDVAYKLELPPHFKIHPVLHISHLKANHDGSQDFPSRPEYKSPPPAIIVGEGETAEEYFSVGVIRNHKAGLLSLEDSRQRNEVIAAQVADDESRRKRTPNEATLERRLRFFQTPLKITTEHRNHQDGEVDNGCASMTCNEPSFDTAAELVEKQLQQLVEHVHLGGDVASAPAGAQNVQADPLHSKHLPPISSMDSRIRRDVARV
ncbi:hypothetical protein CEUSTIGMA_g2322.t1 [Chlamydomonas eustigma]|uniref:Tf2-1-like SH3-like domain-containing protein n=1 Tax=Chlamydomonas eustigma TaxID=1157962 RepID=A0A250WVT2_9CHLO|nr:hypothetical protein CEUSTIGMA_g2322.t1 [Chlamydomonas eustigma]|eukprot:GAX74876.1 hypothetical protein CEUSTIGMA_g2322.t1 [Chlamydomonas eustigma]